MDRTDGARVRIYKTMHNTKIPNLELYNRLLLTLIPFYNAQMLT